MNYYEILEVSQNASKEVIKAAYKSLMQRYHPDRNPGNVEVAEHASRVVQAYELLSDPNKRAAYDNELNLQKTALLENSRNRNWGNQSHHVSKNIPDSSDNKSYRVLWLIIASILLSGGLILSLSKTNQSPQFNVQEVRSTIEGKQLTSEQFQARLRQRDETDTENSEIIKRENELAARTIPVFISNLTLTLRATDKSFDVSGHVLSITLLGVRVGTYDAPKVMRYLENNKELITQKLGDKLAYAKYDELIKIDGEQYLKKIILDSIGETTGTNRLDEYPASSAESPGRYGVVEVFLPESFSLR